MKKIFEVDISDPTACLNLIGILKSHLGTARVKQGLMSRTEKERSVFDACCTIMSTDISAVYQKLTLDVSPKYYTYVHLDTSQKIAIGKDGKTTFAASIGMDYFPFYVGKGMGNRAFDINRNETHRKVRERMALFGFTTKVMILRNNLSELEALSDESKLIDIFGLVVNKGRLTNLDEGLNKVERRKCYQTSLSKISKIYKNSV